MSDRGPRSQRGAGLGEFLILAATASVAVTAATAHLLPGSASRETVRGAAETLHTYLQLARVEAVARERPCRLEVEPRSGALRVLDSLGTPGEDDDLLLHETTIEAQVAQAARVEFGARGQVAPASITVGDGVHFGRVSVDGAAGLAVEDWDGEME